jgi:hypothetical protein
MSKLPSPSEVGNGVDDDTLEAGRRHLAAAMKRNGRNKFTYAADNFPHGTADILLGELVAAGWRYKHNSDWRDGAYYDIWPVR